MKVNTKDKKAGARSQIKWKIHAWAQKRAQRLQQSTTIT